MNTIKELIEKYCPDGVEYKKLEEISNITTGQQFNKRDMNPIGTYPVINGGIDASGYIEQFNEEKDTITISQGGASAGYVNWISTKFWLGAHCYSIKPNEEVVKRYLYHVLKNLENKIMQGKQGAGIPGLNRKVLFNLIIPVPPLSVQREIVRILDSFTSLEAELEAELEARRKQYEYYRDQLLSFKYLSEGGTDEVEWKTLGDIGEVCMCKRIMKNQTNAEGCIPFYKIGTFGKKADAFISEELYDEYKQKYSFPRKGEVLISAAGTIGRAVIYDGEPAYFQDSNIVWIANDESLVLNKYLYYFYSVADWRLEGGTIKRLYNNNLKAVKIPLPSLSTQRRIVSILDRFESLVNDISTGLPAEIAARHQQYEYYRDQLLSFKRKS